MSTDDFEEIRATWKNFLKNLEVIRNHNRLYETGFTEVIPNHLLDKALLSTLIINLVSFLDESLDDFIVCKNILGNKKTLNDKIELLDKEGFLNNSEQLHQLRRVRNNLAHTDIALGDKGIGWGELDDYVNMTSTTLQHLGIFVDIPKYEYFFHRIHTVGDHPIKFSCRYGLMLDGKEILVIEYRIDRFNKASYDFIVGDTTT